MKNHPSMSSENHIADIERVLPPKQKRVADFLKQKIFPQLPPNHFFLVGGTAIALKYGHRQSIDFDFFSFPQNSIEDEKINELEIIFRQEKIYQRKDQESVEGQLNYNIEGVGVVFLPFQNRVTENKEEFYNLPQLPTETNHLGIETLNIKDLAGMKAFARCNRSKMKDLVDLAEILHHEVTFQEILTITEKQFGYDISAKEIVTACLDIDDILQNTLDEPIAYLGERNTEYYINFLKKKSLEYFNENF